MQKEPYYPRSCGDRTGMELISAIFRQRQRENFAKQAQPWIEKATKISDATPMDIMITLAKHGGRVEVQGFGVFYIHEVPGHEVVNKMTGVKTYKPGRRHIRFTASQQMRDMMNEDWFGQQDAPMPNSDFWEGVRNLCL